MQRRIKSKHPAQAAGAPGNSWSELCAYVYVRVCMCVFPGLLPSSGSEALWLSQRCSLIYPLTLCLSLPPAFPPPSLADTLLHLSPRLSPIPSTSLSKRHSLLSNHISFNEKKHVAKKVLTRKKRIFIWHLSHSLAFFTLLSFPYPFSSSFTWPLIFPFHPDCSQHLSFSFLSNVPIFSLILIKCRRLQECTMIWTDLSLKCVRACVHLCFM